MIYGSLSNKGSVVILPMSHCFIQVFVDLLNWEDICLVNILSYVFLIHSSIY
jgi:hypothetical protein